MSNEHTMLPRYVQLVRYDPARSPDWRWRRAQTLIAAERRYSRRRDDEPTGRAMRFLRAWARCRTRRDYARLARRDPDVYAAHEIRTNDQALRLRLEAWTLAGQNDAAIADRLGLPPGVVTCYLQLFFDVRERLSATSYVQCFVLGGGMSTGAKEKDVPTIIKWLAYNCGALILEIALTNLAMVTDLSAPLPDLSTVEGRATQWVRVLIGVARMPLNAKTARLSFNLWLDQARSPLKAAQPIKFAGIVSDLAPTLPSVLVNKVAAGEGSWAVQADVNRPWRCPGEAA